MPGTPVVHWSTKTASLDNQSACICRGRGWLIDSRSERVSNAGLHWFCLGRRGGIDD